MNPATLKKRLARGLFPSPQQELLLRAALLEKEAATQAWSDWKAQTELDDIPVEGFRILPLLYKNLKRHEIEDPQIAKLKGIYRYSWVKNRRALAILMELVARLGEAGIPCIILKGAGLILSTYRDHGVRYMDDCDFLVPYEEAPRAIALMQEWGWWPAPPFARLFRPYVAGLNLDNHHKLGVDLHWHAMSQRCTVEEDRPYWEGKRPIEFEGTQAFVLNPTDQLLHTCINGSYWSEYTRPNWVADAFWQFRAHGAELDWKRLLEIARSHQLSLPLWVTLDYLKERFDLAVPAEVIQQLKDQPRSSRELREHLSGARPRPWLSELPPLWHRFHRHEISRRYPLKAWGFVKFLEGYCGLESIWDLPKDLAKKLWSRTQKNLEASKKQETAS